MTNKLRVEEIVVDGREWQGLVFIQDLPTQLINELGLNDYIDTTATGHYVLVSGGIEVNRVDGGIVIYPEDKVTMTAPNGTKVETFLSEFFNMNAVDADVSDLFDYDSEFEGMDNA